VNSKIADIARSLFLPNMGTAKMYAWMRRGAFRSDAQVEHENIIHSCPDFSILTILLSFEL
jgi:hypothetical protein